MNIEDNNPYTPPAHDSEKIRAESSWREVWTESKRNQAAWGFLIGTTALSSLSTFVNLMFLGRLPLGLPTLLFCVLSSAICFAMTRVLWLSSLVCFLGFGSTIVLCILMVGTGFAQLNITVPLTIIGSAVPLLIQSIIWSFRLLRASR